MASLARGLLLPCGRQCLVGPRLRTATKLATPSATRLLTTSQGLGAASPATKAASKAAADAATARMAPSRYAFIKHLTSKPTPTLLYEAPSHFWFYFGCWGGGLGLLAWTALTGPGVVNQPEGVPRWVGVVYGVCYVILGSMGVALMRRTANIVSAIRVLPAGVGVGNGAEPRLEVSIKRMVPLLRPRVTTARLDQVALQTRLSRAEEHLTEQQWLQQRRDEQARRAALHKADMTRIMTMPFRRLGRALVAMFHGVRSAWTGMNMGHVRVDGQILRLDLSRGFAHDGFRTLERLVKIGWT